MKEEGRERGINVRDGNINCCLLHAPYQGWSLQTWCVLTRSQISNPSVHETMPTNHTILARVGSSRYKSSLVILTAAQVRSSGLQKEVYKHPIMKQFTPPYNATYFLHASLFGMGNKLPESLDFPDGRRSSIEPMSSTCSPPLFWGQVAAAGDNQDAHSLEWAKSVFRLTQQNLMLGLELGESLKSEADWNSSLKSSTYLQYWHIDYVCA